MPILQQLNGFKRLEIRFEMGHQGGEHTFGRPDESRDERRVEALALGLGE